MMASAISSGGALNLRMFSYSFLFRSTASYNLSIMKQADAMSMISTQQTRRFGCQREIPLLRVFCRHIALTPIRALE
jgi:hypothetical protein